MPSQGLLTPGPRKPDTERIDIDAEALSLIGPYRVVSKLGMGGMGVVYKCVDEALKRFVAIKVLRQKYAGDEHYRRRFHREAQTIASLSHPSVAHVYGMGEVKRSGDPLVYIMMEYVDGPSVEALLQREVRLPLERAAGMVRETALGLKEALQKGIVHRDIKPSNLLVTASSGIKIVDFGLAKELGGTNSMTDEGIVVGTPNYISPEQGRGRVVDHRSDIYSLGATFYHMITGRPPFEGNSQVSVIVAHVNDMPPAPHDVEPSLPEAASRVILRMMAKAQEDRYQSYEELSRDLISLSKVESLTEEKREVSGSAARERRANIATALLRKPFRRWTWAFFSFIVLAASAASLALIFPYPRHRPDQRVLAGLGGWLQHLEAGHDVLNMNFAEPPEERSSYESWRRLIYVPRGTSIDSGPRLVGGALRWDSFSAPFACGLVFERMDAVHVVVGATFGSFDLGVAIVDPLGSERRFLLLRLRPGETNPEPILASRNGEAMILRARAGPESSALPPSRKTADHEPKGGSEASEITAVGMALPPVPRLGQGPFELDLRLDTLSSSKTRVRLRVARRFASRQLYQASCELDGTDWASGVLVIQTPSPVTPFMVTLERVVISGLLAPRPGVEEMPWRS